MRKKQFGSLLLTVLCVFSFLIPSFAALSLDENGKLETGIVIGEDMDVPVACFSDVTEQDWYFADVSFVYKNRIMNGTGVELFSPGQGVTRAMMITILYRLAGQPKTGVPAFSDINAEDYYADAVAWGAENGIVKGTSAEFFSPNALITREQLAVMLYNFSKLCGKEIKSADLSAFADRNDVSPWAEDALRFAVGDGLIKGKGENLSPKDGATRAEAAAIIHRFINSVN